jgi:hypothetical protein
MTLTRQGVLAAAISVTLGTTLLSQAPAAPRANAAGNGSFSFGLIGDMPYGPEGELKFPNVIADISHVADSVPTSARGRMPPIQEVGALVSARLASCIRS